MAALQVRALKGNQSAAQRSQLVMMSYYILDAMRIDAAAAKTLNYNTGALDANGNIDAFICSSGAVDGTSLADNNQRAWLDAMKASIGAPGDTSTCGAIACDADGNCTVQIKWDDSLAGGLGEQKFTTSTRI